MRERTRKDSAAARDIEIRSPRNLKLRKKLERSIFNWLRHYFPELFFNPFNAQQKLIVNAVLHAAKHGGDQAVAAPRGEGKTSIAECVVCYCVLTGRLKFPLIAAATGPDAQGILGNIKRHFETNEELGEMYPEVCDPIRALEGASQRANMQTCLGGHRTRLKWGADRIVFPTVPLYKDEHGNTIKSRCCGSVLMTRGLDSAIRGIRYGSLRPDLVLIDDPETRESVESDIQIEKRCRTIDQDIGGLGGPGKRMARLMLCTIMNRKGVAYQYTDPSAKPSWRGVRYKMLVSPPDNVELWHEYVEMRRSGMAAAKHDDGDVDEAIGLANKFYLDRRKAMDAGAIVANPHRFDPKQEFSGLHRCWNIIADLGEAAFATEYQNDPPEEDGPQESGIHAGLVANRLSGLEKGKIPPNCPLLTAAIDVGKVALHWTVMAWSKGGSGAVIDYGVADVWPKNRDSDRAVELAILQALHGLRDQMLSAQYHTPDGEIFQIQTCLVDSGWKEAPVYEFVRNTGGQIFKASKGFGETTDGRKSYFRIPDKQTAAKRVGDHCFLAYQQQAQVWLCGMDSDYWKSWLHQRFMTPEDQPGSIVLFGADKRDHVAFSHHICAEIEVEEFVPDKGLKRYWKKVNRNNHWLDTTYMACVAASLHGMQLLNAGYQAPQRRASTPRRQQFLNREGGWVGGMK
ncbi:MAG TPA: terminase gpA endonuclease subunit [Thermoguttaceae bacterium]|nr:terminase gpA endonuclease subunit [Thermoguttaceae bacterium]